MHSHLYTAKRALRLSAPTKASPAHLSAGEVAF
jgi:hypothetical protein